MQSNGLCSQYPDVKVKEAVAFIKNVILFFSFTDNFHLKSFVIFALQQISAHDFYHAFYMQ